MNAYLSSEQTQVLLRPIKPGRVVHRDGQSNLEAYDVRAHLTRIFGFGRWDEIAISTTLLYEQETTTKAGKPAYKVGYRADRAIVVRDPDGSKLCEYHGSAVGEAILPDFKRGDCHDFAVKKAQSQALKRAAINLGDQFGLSLYAKGSTGAVVGMVVGATRDDAPAGELHEPDVVEEVDPDTGPEHEDEAPAVSPDPEPVPPSPTLPLETPAADTDVPIPPDPNEPLATDAQIKKVQTLFGILEIKDRSAKLTKIIRIIDRKIASSREMTMNEAHRVIEQLEADRAVRADR